MKEPSTSLAISHVWISCIILLSSSTRCTCHLAHNIEASPKNHLISNRPCLISDTNEPSDDILHLLGVHANEELGASCRCELHGIYNGLLSNHRKSNCIYSIMTRFTIPLKMPPEVVVLDC